MKRAEIRIFLTVSDDWYGRETGEQRVVKGLENFLGTLGDTTTLDAMHIETMQVPVEVGRDGKLRLKPEFLDPYSLPEKGVHPEPPPYPSASLEWQQLTVEDA